MKISDLYAAKPVMLWEQRRREGDELFTVERLALCEKALDAYLDKLKEIQTSAEPSCIIPLVEQIVRTFNALNEENDDFIGTMEREQLAEFIHVSARWA